MFAYQMSRYWENADVGPEDREGEQQLADVVEVLGVHHLGQQAGAPRPIITSARKAKKAMAEPAKK